MQTAATRALYLNFLAQLLYERGSAAAAAAGASASAPSPSSAPAMKATSGGASAGHDDITESLQCLLDLAASAGPGPAVPQRNLPGLHKRIAELCLELGRKEEVRHEFGSLFLVVVWNVAWRLPVYVLSCACGWRCETRVQQFVIRDEQSTQGAALFSACLCCTEPCLHFQPLP